MEMLSPAGPNREVLQSVEASFLSDLPVVATLPRDITWDNSESTHLWIHSAIPL